MCTLYIHIYVCILYVCMYVPYVFHTIYSISVYIYSICIHMFNTHIGQPDNRLTNVNVNLTYLNSLFSHDDDRRRR